LFEQNIIGRDFGKFFLPGFNLLVKRLRVDFKIKTFCFLHLLLFTFVPWKKLKITGCNMLNAQLTGGALPRPSLGLCWALYASFGSSGS
jgi:hypothetical protein